MMMAMSFGVAKHAYCPQPLGYRPCNCFLQPKLSMVRSSDMYSSNIFVVTNPFVCLMSGMFVETCPFSCRP